MITELILSFLLYVPTSLVENIPTFEIAIPDGVFDGLSKICACIGWFPIAQLIPLFSTTICVRLSRILWAMAMRIKSFIPTMGD